MGWRPAGLSVLLPLLSSPCTIKPRRWHAKTPLLGITPWSPHIPTQIGGGKPSQNAAQLCAKAESCVHDYQRADKRWKCWGFWVGSWNVDSLAGRAGELIETLADRDVDMVLQMWYYSKTWTHVAKRRQWLGEEMYGVWSRWFQMKR